MTVATKNDQKPMPLQIGPDLDINKESTLTPKAYALASLQAKISGIRTLCIFSQALFVAGIPLNINNAVRLFGTTSSWGAIATVCAVACVGGIYASRVFFSSYDEKIRDRMFQECGVKNERSKFDKLVYSFNLKL